MWIGLPSRRARGLLDRAIVRLLPAVPRPIVRRLSSRYIAGPSLDDAIRVVAAEREGKLATVDVLGEEIATPTRPAAIAGQYHDVLARIDDEGLDANISIKLTGLGLELDRGALSREPRGGRRRCRGARQVRAHRHGGLVDDRRARSPSTASCATTGTRTSVSCCRRTCAERYDADLPGLDNVRHLQGDLRRAGRNRVPGADEVRASYVRCLERAARPGRVRRDRDPRRAADRRGAARRRSGGDLPPDRYEFQMLLGVRLRPRRRAGRGRASGCASTSRRDGWTSTGAAAAGTGERRRRRVRAASHGAPRRSGRCRRHAEILRRIQGVRMSSRGSSRRSTRPSSA